MKTLIRCIVCLFWVAFACAPAEKDRSAEPLAVAVSSNFNPVMNQLVVEFGRHTGIFVQGSSGSTGMHFAQISSGAPFDLFFAADAERVIKLEKAGKGIPGSRFTYAYGRLVLWTPELFVDLGPEESLDESGNGSLSLWRDYDVNRFAIANPKLAPYGLASQHVLQRLGLWEELQDKLVFGQNIAHAHQFVSTRNAQIGLVAASQVHDSVGSSWEVPADLYAPIEQQAIQLTDHPHAAKFIEFVRGPVGRKIIGESGYSLPDS